MSAQKPQPVKVHVFATPPAANARGFESVDEIRRRTAAVYVSDHILENSKKTILLTDAANATVTVELISRTIGGPIASHRVTAILRVGDYERRS